MVCADLVYRIWPASSADVFIHSRRYWEDSLCEEHIPRLPGELDNSPGIGRIERLTNDEFKYSTLVMSRSDK